MADYGLTAVTNVINMLWNELTYPILTTVKVSNKALQNNVATLTTVTPHGLVTGDKIRVSNIDTVFNGIYTVASTPTPTSITYTLVGVNLFTTVVPPYGFINKVGAGVINPEDYPVSGGARVVPIMPVQEQVEIKDLIANPSLPYLVYDFDLVGYDTEWVICKERLTFKIFSPDVPEILKIMNVMIDLFRRFDESAKDMNDYAKTVSPNSPFKYHYFTLSEANSPDPAEELAGRMEADIAITYAYSREVNSSGRFA
jgi:hypothetical protein